MPRDGSHLLERLCLIIRKISGRLDLEVTADAGRAQGHEHDWFTVSELDPANPDTVQRTWVYIPAVILEASENIAKGKAAHEAGHVAITRHGSFIPDEVLQMPGFHALASSVEERPVDQVVRDRYPGAGAWLREARLDSAAAGLSTGPHRLPVFFQVCDLIVYAPYIPSTNSFAPEALGTYEAIVLPLERLEHTLPEEGASETRVRELAIERYRILYEEIWPRVRPLLESDVRTEFLRRLLEEESVKGRIPERHRGEARDLSAGRAPGERMSLELRHVLERAAAAIPRERRSRAEEDARAAMAGLEDRVARERDGGLDPLRPETHEEFENRRDREALERRTGDELREIGRSQAALVSRSPYDRAYESVRTLEEGLYWQLEELFRPRIVSRGDRARSGPSVELKAVFRRDAGREAGARQVEDRIFETRRRPQKRDYAVLLLIDLSGSMTGGGKIEEAFKAVVLFAEVLNRLDVRHEILGFQDEIIVFKEWDEGLNGAVRQRLAGILAEVTNTNPGGHNAAEFNDDGPCLLAAAKSLERQMGREKLLIVISDGVPAGASSGEEELREAVREILTPADVILIGLGLGPETDHVADFYPVALPNILAVDLPGRLSALLGEVLKSPEQFRVE